MYITSTREKHKISELDCIRIHFGSSNEAQNWVTRSRQANSAASSSFVGRQWQMRSRSSCGADRKTKPRAWQSKADLKRKLKQHGVAQWLFLLALSCIDQLGDQIVTGCEIFCGTAMLATGCRKKLGASLLSMKNLQEIKICSRTKGFE